jgi:hypothetical protein
MKILILRPLGIANTSKKGDICKLSDGTAGICASADTAGCELALKLKFYKLNVPLKALVPC